MYQVVIKQVNGNNSQDFFSDKNAAIRFIVRETGISHKAVAPEFIAKSDSVIHRDNLGWRAEIYYTDKRGGKRKGAGRPPSLPTPGKPVTVWLTSVDEAYLSKLGKGNVSAGIRKLIQIVNETPS